jgi:hypothetical protein
MPDTIAAAAVAYRLASITLNVWSAFAVSIFLRRPTVWKHADVALALAYWPVDIASRSSERYRSG